MLPKGSILFLLIVVPLKTWFLWRWNIFVLINIRIRVRLVQQNMFKSSNIFLTNRSKVVFLFWILSLNLLCVCLPYCIVCSLHHCDHLLGNGCPLGSLTFMWCLFVFFLSLSHMVSWLRCGTWLYWFLIFDFFANLNIYKALSSP